MRGKNWLILVVSLALVLLASSLGITRSSLFDLEGSSGNAFQAWASNLWRQTTQDDFNAGILQNVQVLSPGDVKLAAKADWYDINWQYRRAIIIDHTKVQDVVNPSTSYADFPVLVYATGLSNIKANGADIRFTSSDGITELPREIERYSGGILYAWVKVTLTKDAGDSSNDVIYMYYGNAAATEPAPGSTYGSQNVWDSNYKGVWHLKEDPTGTAPQMKDSTSNNNNGTSQGSMTTGDQVTGKIDGSLDFDGVNDCVVLPEPPASSTNISPGSVFAWIKTSNAGTSWRGIVVKQWAFGMLLYNNKFVIFDWTTLSNISTGINLADGNWHFVGFTFQSGISNGTKLYIDGAERLTTTFTVSNQNEGIVIGAGNNPATWQFFSGIIDEARISNVVCSPDWIKTEYNNQSSPSSFCSVGSVEQQTTTYITPGTIASQVWDTGISGARWDGLFWDEILSSGTDITFEVRASDTLFAKDTPDATLPWTSVGGIPPVTSGLPSGRYMQWRATLITSDTSQTPILQEVRVYHY